MPHIRRRLIVRRPAQTARAGLSRRRRHILGIQADERSLGRAALGEGQRASRGRVAIILRSAALCPGFPPNLFLKVSNPAFEDGRP